jgi:ABC-2 type transport system permease protein
MKKAFLIARKDLQILFRDRTALILMLLAPFALTVALGLVTGSFSARGNSGISDIPVAVINHDTGEMGAALVEILTGPDLIPLLAATVVTDEAAARDQVRSDQLAALVVIPAGFSASVIPSGSGERGAVVPLELVASPNRPISTGIVKSILDEFVNRVETGILGIQVTMTRLVMSGTIPLSDAFRAGEAIGERRFGELETGDSAPLIALQRATSPQQESSFNPLAYFAPGMALIFLMYTVTMGGRSFLTERQNSTLDRQMSAPLPPYQIVAGKVLGIVTSGVAQVSVLVIGSTLLFRLAWGDGLAVAVLIVAAAFAATGWGLLIAALSRTPNQVTNYGTALMLVFGIVGGGFVNLPRAGLALWAGMLTPNAWALDGFMLLHQGGQLADIGGKLLALLVMGLLLFLLSAFVFGRKAGERL